MRMAALQMQTVTGDPPAVLARAERAAREAAERAAELLVLPELALPGYGAGSEMAALAEPADGSAIARLRSLADATGITIVAGFAERGDGVCFNSAALVAPGQTPVVYRKSHLYGDYERALFAAATPGTVVVPLGGLRVGLLICYDVEFPENVRRLALAGADLVVVPTALPAGPYAPFIARQLIAVRAFENQVHLAYVNHCGGDSHFRYAGLSRIVAPDGNVLAHAGAAGEELLVADIEPDRFAGSRAQNSYLRDLGSLRPTGTGGP